MGIILGGAGGLMIALAFLKYEKHQKFRWTIKLIYFGIGVALLSNTSDTFSKLVVNLLFFPSVFGVIGFVVDFVKNRKNDVENHEQGIMAKSIINTEKNHTSVTKNVKQKENISRSSPDSSSMPITKKSNLEVNKIWEIIAEEFQSESKKKGLYARCFAETNGDEAKAKALYYKERYSELMYANENAVYKVDAQKNTTDETKQFLHSIRNERGDISDEDCYASGFYAKLMINGYECFDLDNGRAMVVTPKRKIIYLNLSALESAMREQLKSGSFKNSVREIYS